MQRRRLIRGARMRAARSGPRLRGVDGIFWLMLIFAIMVGGAQALNGFPQLVATLVPPGLMATQAKEPPPRVFDPLPLALVQTPSPFLPEVLEPLHAHALPVWLRGRSVEPPSLAAVTFHTVPAQPAIAIVIDDLGNDVVAARRAIALPKEVTLSFLPYPDATPDLARAAAAPRSRAVSTGRSPACPVTAASTITWAAALPQTERH